MFADANALRGEAPVRIGKAELVIVVEFGRLAKLSKALRCETMDELYRRLIGFEPYAVAVALRILATDPAGADAAETKAIAAIGQLSSADQGAWREAIEAALTGHIDKGRVQREETLLVEDVENMVRDAEAAMAEGGGKRTGKKPDASPSATASP